jgi:heat shock protein 4
MVGFGESRKMGEQATSGVSSNYKNTIKGSMKCLIGLSFDDPAAQKEFKINPGLTFVPIAHAGGENRKDTIGVKVVSAGQESVVPIEAVAGMMIKHMAQVTAETQKSPLPSDYVICIPFSYTDAQRRALITACEMVGITSGVLRLMHENTAVALAYGIFKDLKKEFIADEPQHVLFIDMGASAFTCSVTTFEPGKLMVKSAYYDNEAGGRDFDWIIAEWLSAQFEKKYAGKLSGKPMDNPKAVLKLLTAAEKAKKTLSPNGVKEVRIQLEMLIDELDFSCTLSAAEYEAMCAPLLARLRHPVEAALKEAGLEPKDLSGCEIVGGSSRIGCVKRELTKILGGDVVLSTTLNADEAVARGAALQSAILSPRFKVLPYDIQEAQPFPIVISWEGDAAAAVGTEVDAVTGAEAPTDSVVMFDRGLSFPIVRRVTLRRSGTFIVKSKYDDAALKYGYPEHKAREIADFAIETPKGDEDKKVRVNVKQDIHGIIHLSSAQMVEEVEDEAAAAAGTEAAPIAGDADAAKKDAPAAATTEEEKKATKKIKKTNLEFKVSRPVDWTRDEVDKVYEAEVAMANTDRIVQETADKRNELESYIYDMRDKVSSDSHYGPYGTDAEKADFASRNENMENWLYEEGFDATKAVYVEQLAELKKYGDPIKQRKMEAEARPVSVNSLKASLEVYNKWVNESQTDEKYAHITDDERATVHSKCDETSTWLYGMLDKQGGMAGNQDPVLTVALLNTKKKELIEKCKPIMTKAAPKKKKEEAPKKEDPPAASSAETPAAAEPPVSDTEPMEGVEKEAEAEEAPKMQE